MAGYFQYSAQTIDDTPLYLFDNLFGEKEPSLLEQYTVPPYFQKDYFSYIPGKDRPSYRWILVGPPRSGSTFHQDPNQTSAWNGLISGAKKWLLFPSSVTPPGVIPSDDNLQVTTSISVTEWFVNFYKEARRMKEFKAIECVQRPGDLVFIPHGWWHTALNLEESIAVTQNVVNDENVIDVVEFLRKKKKKDVWLCLEANIKEKAPETYQRIQDHIQAKERQIQARKELASLFATPATGGVGFSLGAASSAPTSWSLFSSTPSSSNQ